MKKQYKQPELYVENVIVEQGIAQSTVTLWYLDGGEPTDNGFGLGDATYGEETFLW